MNGEFKINHTPKPKYIEILPEDKTLRRLTKVESLALKSKIAILKQQREVELSTPEPLKDELLITVLPAQKGWVDKKDHRKERSGRSELERRSLYRRDNKNFFSAAQERVAMGR
jgi:predicted metal-dependent hydrolase